MKNQRGVTLIALVVTIIVLIILAGVAIAALTGENGLITRSRESKKLQIEGEVRDEITLAIAAAKAFAENKSTVSAGFNAAADLGESTSLVNAEIVKDLTAAKGFTVTPSAGSIAISYTTAAYQNACNNTAANSTISVTVTVSRNNFTIGTYSYGTYQA